jgi:hypothetical protein
MKSKTQTQQIREALAVGDQISGLRNAAQFFDRSKRGTAYDHPDVYRHLAEQPDQIMIQPLSPGGGVTIFCWPADALAIGEERVHRALLVDAHGCHFDKSLHLFLGS